LFYLRGVKVHVLFSAIDDHEVIAAAMHFGKSNAH